MSDQTGLEGGAPATEEEGQGAPAPAPPPADPPPADSQPPAAAPASSGNANTNRPYGIFTEVKLAVGTAADRKAAVDQLAALAPQDGNITVLVRVGNAVATEPRKALIGLGQVRELSGDYEVVADSARNKYQNVKTEKKVDVSIG